MSGHPRGPGAMLQSAIAAIASGDARGGEAILRKILESDPENAAAYINLGVALRAQGRLDDAVAAYARALQGAASNPAVYRNLGNALRDKGMHPEAALCYLRAAQLLRGLRRWTDAAQICREALGLMRGPAVRHELAISLVRQGSHAEALRHLEWIVDDAQAFARVARFALAGGDVALVHAGGEELRFRVRLDTQNLGISMKHASGVLYEAEELAYCAAWIAPGAVIVDVGANVGNHLVFFAKVLKPKKVIAIEPHPEAIAQLRDNIALNAIDCADLSLLGIGVAGARGRFRLVQDVDLAQASLRPARDGGIQALPLDELLAQPVDFLKIDVEGMELEVLSGARRLLERQRPRLMVEVSDRNLEAFRSFCVEHRYKLAREFLGEGYRNCFVMPA